MNNKPRIGLALGGGSARGWAHIGVIRELEKLGITPEIICGSSIGALVGGAYASNKLDPLEDWLKNLDWQETLKYLDFGFHGGLIEGKKLFDFFLQHLTDSEIKDLPVVFSAVATNLETGNETWIKQGSLLDAIRASIALPGLFTPVHKDGSWLVDGALVNPMPVSLCRKHGADIIIAVDLTSGLIGRYLKQEKENKPGSDFMDKLLSFWGNKKNNHLNNDNKPQAPSVYETISSALTIVQNELTQNRLAIDPPDIVITPQLAHIGLLEFYRANDAMEAGKAAVQKSSKEIKTLMTRSENITD